LPVIYNDSLAQPHDGTHLSALEQFKQTVAARRLRKRKNELVISPLVFAPFARLCGHK
jgi:hypothetical protein